MAIVTRTSGLSNIAGTINPFGCKGFLITVQNVKSDIDLRAEDDAVDEAVEQIPKEVNLDVHC